MQADFLSLQALFVAGGILAIWFFWRIKPWRAGARRGPRRPSRNARPADTLIARKAEGPIP